MASATIKKDMGRISHPILTERMLTYEFGIEDEVTDALLY